MKNELILTCVGSTALKFLEITLPQNIQFFDNTIVITDSKDIKTQEFCKNFNLTLLITDSFYWGGMKFNRSPGYNKAFELLQFHDEFCTIDCDIWIPDKLGAIIKDGNFDKEFAYGCRRVIVPKYSDFLKILEEDTIYKTSKLKDSLWCPFGIGYGFYFMANCNSSTIKKYGFNFPPSFDSSESDWKFRNRWGETINGDKEYIGLLKELPEFCYHLSQPNIEGGKNFFIA